MKIRLETELDWRELDAFIEGVSGATFFQSSTFLTGLEAFCGYSVLALTLREGGALAALLPFAEKRRRGFSLLECLPFGTPGGPLLAEGADPAFAEALLAAFLDKTGGRVLRASAVLPADESLDIEGPDRMITQVLDLEPGYEILAAKAVAPAKRRQVRQSGERGLLCRRSADPADLAAWHAIYLENADRWELSHPMGLDFLEHLLRDERRVELTLAEREGELIGASLDLYQGGEAYYWMGAGRREFGHLRTSAALYDARLRRACERGALRLNLGFSPDKPELFRYKRDFGGRPLACALRSRSRAGFAFLQRLRGRSA